MDDQRLSRWREQAREHAIPEPDIDEWLALARPHLTLYRAQQNTAALDAAPAAPVVGYCGGRPSLPLDVEWSGRSDLVATIDCAALPADLPGFPLPEDGRLLFFHFGHGEQSSFTGCDGWVQYIPPGTATTERSETTELFDEALRLGVEPQRFPLQCWPYVDIPNVECHGEFGSPAHFLESLPEGFMDLIGDLEDPRPAHVRDGEAFVLGGYCRAESDACASAAYSDREHKRWRLLASTVREVYDGREGVPHLVHWIIRQDDLAARDFDQVQTHTVCLWA